MVCPSSKVKKGIVSILEREGFIANWQEVDTAGKRKGTVLKSIEVSLRYDEDHNSNLRGLKRVSKPSRRFYVAAGEIPTCSQWFGIAILTTNKGLLTDKEARDASVGGEVLCYIW